MAEVEEKGKLIKEALKLVESLSKLYPYTHSDEEDAEKLVERANKLIKNKYWKLT